MSRARAQPRAVRVGSSIAAFAWAAMIFALSSQSEPVGAGWIDLPGADLLAHAVLYAGLALWLRGAGLGPVAAIVAATVYGATDEIHQAFVPARTPSLADLAADGVGALVGATWLARWAARVGVSVFEGRPS